LCIRVFVFGVCWFGGFVCDGFCDSIRFGSLFGQNLVDGNFFNIDHNVFTGVDGDFVGSCLDLVSLFGDRVFGLVHCFDGV
jgi:hypothetical protein